MKPYNEYYKFKSQKNDQADRAGNAVELHWRRALLEFQSGP